MLKRGEIRKRKTPGDFTDIHPERLHKPKGGRKETSSDKIVSPGKDT